MQTATKKKLIDLHTHSTFSDGTDSVQDLVSLCVDANLSAFALTDHDTVAGIDLAIETALNIYQETGYLLEVVPGVELSTYYKKHEIHIVGLYIDHKDKSFLNALNRIRFLREERVRKMCAKLTIMGVDIDYDDITYFYKSTSITRAHIADYLLLKGYIKNRREAFDKYIGSKGEAFIPLEKISAIDGIELILNAGGIPILAHPVSYRMEDYELSNMLLSLKACGLVGMETIYSTNSISFTDKSKFLAKKFGLLNSGGSDYHGKMKPLIKLGVGMGNLKVPYEFLEKIREFKDGR